MNRKSITQEYFTLAVDENGNMPPMRRDEANAGLVVAGCMDLLLNDVIAWEKKKITVIKEIPNGLSHLASLYAYLNEKPCSTDKLMSDYHTGNRIKQLTEEIGESLLADDVAAKGTGGLLGSKTIYIPEKGYKDEVIGFIKSSVTKDDEITPHDAALLYILKETKNLNQYFSKHENDILKGKLEEIKKNPQNKQLAAMINYVSGMTAIMAAVVLTSTLS